MMDTSDNNRMAIYAVFLLFLTRRTADGALLSYPSDRNVTVGEHVILPCATDLHLPVYWYFNGHEIFYGGKVSMSFQSMFSVSSSKTGEYNLVISSADTSYNGLYACGDDEGQGEKKSAHLYVTATATVTVAAPGGATDGDVNTGMVIGIVIAIIVLLLVILGAVCFYKKCVQSSKKPGVFADPKDIENGPLLTENTNCPPASEKNIIQQQPGENRNCPPASEKNIQQEEEEEEKEEEEQQQQQQDHHPGENRNCPPASEKNIQQQQQEEDHHPGAETSKRTVTGGGEVVKENYRNPKDIIKDLNKESIPENKNDTTNLNVAAKLRPMGARTQDDAELAASNAAPSDTDATTVTEDSGVGHREDDSSAVDTTHGASSRPTTPNNAGFRVNAVSPASVTKQTEHDTTSSNESKAADEGTKVDLSVTDYPGGDSGEQSSTPSSVSKPKPKPRMTVSPIQKGDESKHQGEKPIPAPKPRKPMT